MAGVNIIEARTFPLNPSDDALKQGIIKDFRDPRRYLFWESGPGLPNILEANSQQFYIIVADGVFNLKVKQNIDIKDLKSVSSMDVCLNPWKD